MNNTYLVNWSDKSIDDAKEIEAKTSKDAYLKFIEENVYRSVAVTVWSEGEASKSEDFEDHIQEAEDRELNDEHKPISHSSSFADQKLDKIYDVLNHIRWIGLGIGGMFALTFIVPQMCTGG